MANKPAEKIDFSKIMTEAVCLELRFSKLWTRRAVSQNDVSVKARRGPDAEIREAKLAAMSEFGFGDPDQDAMHVGKDILESEELKDVHSMDNEFVGWLRRRAIPTRLFHRGIYLLSYAAVEAVIGRMEEFTRGREKAVEEFLAVYPEKAEQAKAKLGGLFDPADYPDIETIRGAFGVRWKLFEWGGTPEKIRGIDAALFARMKKEQEETLQSAAIEIRDALRVAMSEFVSHLVDKLTGGEEGRPKKFKQSSIDGMNEFLEAFESRNITGDADLSRLVAQARIVMGGGEMTARDLKDNDALRKLAVDQFTRIKGSLDGMLEARPTRKISREV